MNLNNILVFGFLAIILLGGISLAIFQSRKRAELLARQAEKRGGKITNEGIFHRRKLLLNFQGLDIAIYSVPGGEDRPPRTIAQVNPDSPRFPTISITRNGLIQKIMTAFGRERIISGNEEFDRRFVVKSEDSYQAQRLLAADIQNELMQFPFRGLSVRIRPQELSLSITAISKDDEGYDRFIDLVYHILQRIT